MDIILTAVPVALVAVFVGSVIGFQLHNVLSTKSARAVKEASAQQLRRTNANSAPLASLCGSVVPYRRRWRDP